MAPFECGKGNRLKRVTQKKQQIITDHAVRQEGHRRKRIFAALKAQASHDRIKQVYRDFAETLRAKALRSQPPPAASAPAEPSAEPPSRG